MEPDIYIKCPHCKHLNAFYYDTLVDILNDVQISNAEWYKCTKCGAETELRKSGIFACPPKCDHVAWTPGCWQK